MLATMNFSPTEQIRRILTTVNMDNLPICNKVAALFMETGKNRNILLHRKVVTDYVACALYRLASGYPVRITSPEEQVRSSGNPPIICRTKAGDMVHLIVLLSESPMRVLRYLFMDENIVRTMPDLHARFMAADEAYISSVLSPVCVSANRLMVGNRLEPWLKDSFTFRIAPDKATDSDTLPLSVFSLQGRPAPEAVMRCQADLSLLVDDGADDTLPTLAKLGTRLRILREHMGLTQKQLSEQLGLNSLRCYALENGGAVSAGVLFTFLLHYSRTVNIDVLFSDRLWAMAQFDHELLLKKVHLSSVVNQSLKCLDGQIIRRLTETRMSLLSTLDDLCESVSKDMGTILRLTDVDDDADEVP